MIYPSDHNAINHKVWRGIDDVVPPEECMCQGTLFMETNEVCFRTRPVMEDPHVVHGCRSSQEYSIIREVRS
jgi:hypothetical protein